MPLTIEFLGTLRAVKVPSLQGSRVLVVEDEFIIAEDMCMQLERCGFEIIGPAATVEHALELIGEATALDYAVLDLNLRGHPTYPVADALMARAIPFVFVTGYDPRDIPPPYRDLPQVDKPLSISILDDEQGTAARGPW